MIVLTPSPRVVLGKADGVDMSKDPKRWETWAHKLPNPVLLCSPAQEHYGPNGKLVIQGGVEVQFVDHYAHLDKKGKHYKTARQGIMEGWAYRNKTVVCLSDLDTEQRRRVDPKWLGVSAEGRLKAMGVRDEKHANLLREELGLEDDSEKASMRQRIAELEGQLQGPKPSGRRPKNPRDLQPGIPSNEPIPPDTVGHSVEPTKADEKD